MAHVATFNDDMTLAEARDLLRTLVDEGERCPCCAQFAKVYKRKLNATMVRTLGLLAVASSGGDAFVHVPTVMKQDAAAARELGKLAYFELAEESTEQQRPDGGKAGYWRVTARGQAFLEGRATVWKYAHVYAGRRLRFTGDAVGIAEVAPAFNYGELMAGV